jgi:hypothetical protein
MANPLASSTLVSLTGTPEPTKQPDIAKAFDDNATTYTDTHAVNGAYYAVLDFGPGKAITVQQADLLVRQDSYGTSRASNLQLQGSNDLSTWTPLTGNAKATLAWQNLVGTSTGTGYRYLKIANTTYINIAELRLFGTVTP